VIGNYYNTRLQGTAAYNFLLPDPKGNLLSLDDLKGKVVLIDFWFTGCFGCQMVAKYMPQVENNFKGDTNIVFVSISVDKNKQQWLKSVKESLYTSPGSIKLYTEGKGADHP